MFKTGPRTRKNLFVLGASALVPLSLMFAAGAGANPGSEAEAPAGDDALVCCTEMAVAQQPELNPEVAPDALPDADLVAATDAPEEAVVVPASYAERSAEALPAGVVSERGLQIKTILVERSVSAEFPQIHTMIGVRPDSKPWHPNGLALDIMIPNSGSAEGIALGDSILAYAMRNAGRFGVQDVIWRGTYYTPGGGASGSGYGHYDHVHITTTGGGYPSGGEEYLAG
ncbi:MAG: hypothetical protein NT146_09780 [Mycobacterium sp.]|nr:hypothetical protein [Mycobacterium sp.]